MKKQQNTTAALYCRLSVDDGNLGGSVSIETQKLLLSQYCKDRNITEYSYYCDDGCSGTNFNRPAFRQMLEDIEDGKIGAVIVKDLSRFGRNYVEVGLHVERFKLNNIRFVAVDDNYDSTRNEDDLMFPMRNVMNEMYARDVSKKTKAAKKAKARSGQFIGSRAPFGYKLDPTDRHHLIIDEPAAQVVRRIFRLAAEGVGYNKTVRMFRDEKIMTPIAYFNRENPDFYKSDYWRQDFDWHVTSIRAILENEVYLGQIVYGKRRCISMKSTRTVKNAPEDWIVVENCHEPIISRELWDMVRKVLSAKHRTAKSGEVQMFSGLIYCSDCGHALTYSQRRRVDGSYHGAYSCWMYKTHGKGYCSSHYITFDAVYNLVLTDIQRVIFEARKHTDKFRETLEVKRKSLSETESKCHAAELESLERRYGELEKIIRKLYEDSVLGRISDERYESMLREYEQKQHEIREQIPLLKAQVSEAKRESEAADKFMRVINKFTIMDELNAAVLGELIDRIVVHDREIMPDGNEYQQIEIFFRFVGKIGNTANIRKVA